MCVPCLGEGKDLHVLQTLAEKLLAVPVEFDEGELPVGGERGVDGADERLHRLTHEILTFLQVRVAELARGPSLFCVCFAGRGVGEKSCVVRERCKRRENVSTRLVLVFIFFGFMDFLGRFFRRVRRGCSSCSFKSSSPPFLWCAARGVVTKCLDRHAVVRARGGVKEEEDFGVFSRLSAHP